MEDSDKYNDDRTDEQKQTHRYFVIGRDICLSGWGRTQGGTSYAIWSCVQADAKKVMAWVRSRPDMKNVRFGWESVPIAFPRDHVHIYVVTEGHPALGPLSTKK